MALASRGIISINTKDGLELCISSEAVRREETHNPRTNELEEASNHTVLPSGFQADWP
jgi:hypothetical protein